MLIERGDEEKPTKDRRSEGKSTLTDTSKYLQHNAGMLSSAKSRSQGVYTQTSPPTTPNTSDALMTAEGKGAAFSAKGKFHIERHGGIKVSGRSDCKAVKKTPT